MSNYFSMFRKAWRPLSVALVAALLCLLAIRFDVFRHPAGPLDISLWYWHSPFHINQEEAKNYHALGVNRLFVRAGTISTGGQNVKLILPQHWQPSPGAPQVDLVFALDSGMVSHFGQLDNRAIAQCVAMSFTQQRRAAEGAGVTVRGVQLDFDCATRLLPKYTDLLRLVRQSLPERTVLSLTSLPTWFTSSNLRPLVQQVDFYCPQFYETGIGRTLSDVQTVSDLRILKDGLAAARKLGKPFYAGIPAYGHAFMFDDGGRLLGTYRGMSATGAFRHPSFRQARSWSADSSAKSAASPKQWIGEEFVDLVAVHPGAGGKGLGYHLLYSLPTAQMLALNLQMVREHRPWNCQGVIIFRSPEPDEIMALPLPTLSAVLQGHEPQPVIHAGVKIKPLPWELREADRGDLPSVLTVSLTNTGDTDTYLSDDAVTLTLHFDAPGVEAMPGEFNRMNSLSAAGLQAGPSGTSTLVCTHCHLAVGETITLGPIHVFGGARSMYGEWKVRTPGGFADLTGKINAVQLRQ